MEKKFQLVITDRTSNAIIQVTEHRDLGDAMIALKHFGNRLLKYKGNPDTYEWRISNESEDHDEDEFKLAYGRLNKLGDVVIIAITTY